MRAKPTSMLALTVALLVGCAPANRNGTVPGAGIGVFPPDDKGVVTGTLRLYGGPATANGRMALNGTPASFADVLILSAGGAQTRTTTDRTGRFTFRLSAGTYRLACGEPRGELIVWPEITLDVDCAEAIP